MNEDIAGIRRDYKLKNLLEEAVEADAMQQFKAWWHQAINSNIDEVNAFTLATCINNNPHARIVLLKDVADDGFIFFTNYESNKGQQLSANPYAAITFFWKELERQVRIEGTVEKISKEDSDAYYNIRPFESRLGAWASPQSRVISSRAVLDDNMQQLSKKFDENAIERPAHWGGYIVKPATIEFWQGRSNRLHDRLLYTKQNNSWKIERLAP